MSVLSSDFHMHNLDRRDREKLSAEAWEQTLAAAEAAIRKRLRDVRKGKVDTTEVINLYRLVRKVLRGEVNLLSGLDEELLGCIGVPKVPVRGINESLKEYRARLKEATGK